MFLLAAIVALHLMNPNDVVPVCPTPVISAPAFACRNGTATAYVAPVDGASYEWSVEGATILGAADTNRVALQITGDTSVKLHFTVRTNACGSKNGSGVIQIREPIVVREFKVPPTTNANEPLTITWSYEPGREPQSQLLAGDLFPQPVTLDTSQRSYTFTPQNGGSRTIELRASYARAISVTPPSKKRRRSASGAPVASECPSALATAKVDVRGCVESEPILNAPFDAGAGSTFDVAVEIDDGQKVEWSVENGSVQSVSPFYHEATIVAGTSGETKVTARVERKPGCFASASTSVAIILPANQCAITPTATVTLLSHDCEKALMHVTFTGNAPFAGEWSDGTPFRSSTSTGYYFTKPGTLTIDNFRDSSCFGTVNGATTLEQFKPVVLLDSSGGCGGTTLVATFKGVPPFTGWWSDGHHFTTSETTLSRVVQGGPYFNQNRWWIGATDAACKSNMSISRTIEVPETPRVSYGGTYCQTTPGVGTQIGAYFYGGTGPFGLEWSDGTKIVSPFNRSVSRSVPPISGASAQYELVRAYVGSCELPIENSIATVLNRPQAAMQTPPTTFGCTGETLTATLLQLPLPEATIDWVFSTNARVISGQGTPTITFTLDSPLKFDLAVVTKYPDGHCDNYPWTTPKVTYNIAQRRTVKNIRLEPSTIKPGGTATITWELFANPGVSVTTTQARKLELHQAEDCCTAYFVDTTGPGTVPIYVDWYDPCSGSQRQTLTLSIVP